MSGELTVVVPTRNSAATLEWTLASLFGERNVSLRIVAVDSDSTDETLQICSSWGVSVLHEPPGSMYRAINAGLQPAETEWLSYLNSDDMVYPFSYSRMIEEGRRRGAGLVYGACDFVDSENRFLFSRLPPPPRGLYANMKWGYLPFGQPAAIFRRAHYAQVGGFDDGYRLVGDFHFFCRLLQAGVQCARVPGPAVAAFRLHAGQLSQAKHEVRAEHRKASQALRLKTSPVDWLHLAAWKFSNVLNYTERVLRRAALRGAPSPMATVDS
jgi:glycosyltransferase involved in cell wall biosynthesis